MTISQKPTDILKEEHKEVLQKLAALEDIFRHLDDRNAVASQLKELSSFFNTDFWVHFTKEEEALFPEMEKFIPRESGPIGAMLVEHEYLRNTNDKIQQVVHDYLGGSEDKETKSNILVYGYDFIETLREHIEKEDNILFEMADMHLDKSQIEAVVGLFKELETGS